MKKLLLLLAGLSLLAACENNKKKDMSFEMQTLTVRENLETVAKDLASNRDWLTQEVTNDLGKYKSVKLGVVKPDARLNKVGFHGETFELAVVSYYRTQGMISGLQKSASTGDFIVALDPDEFYVSEDIDAQRESGAPIAYTIPAFRYVEGASAPVQVEIEISSQVTYDAPVFFLTLEESAEAGKLAKSAAHPSTPQAGTYLVFIGAQLRSKMDDSNEEFELYLSDGQHTIDDPFLSTTENQFNLVQRNDASGRQRLYPDIEVTGTMQDFEDPVEYIAINKLTPSLFRLVAIESDYEGTGGKYNRTSGTSSTTGIDYFDMASANDQIHYDISSKFSVYYNKTLNDDRYVHSGVYNINDNNMSARLGGAPSLDTDDALPVGSKLSQINWRLGRVVYP